MTLRSVMTLLPILWIVGGCATVTPNPWDSIEVPSATPQRPLHLPAWPIPATFDDDSATYTLDQLRALDAYRVASEANHGIASEHAQQVELLQDAVAALVEAGQSQRVVAEMRQEILEEERRHHTFQKVGLYAIILGLIGISVQ